MDKYVKCVDCGKFTTQIEADYRKFNTGLCTCGGELIPANEEVEDE